VNGAGFHEDQVVRLHCGALAILDELCESAFDDVQLILLMRCLIVP
jgi:hypothetical protein